MIVQDALTDCLLPHAGPWLCKAAVMGVMRAVSGVSGVRASHATIIRPYLEQVNMINEDWAVPHQPGAGDDACSRLGRLFDEVHGNQRLL